MTQNNLTANDAATLLQLIQRTQITGADALPVAVLQQKLANIANGAAPAAQEAAAAPTVAKTRKPRKIRQPRAATTQE